MTKKTKKAPNVVCVKSTEQSQDAFQEEFWGRLIPAMNKTGSRLFQDARPVSANWLGVETAIRRISLHFTVSDRRAWAALRIDRIHSVDNRRIHDQLFAMKERIEATFGGELQWQVLNAESHCQILADIPGAVSDRDQWDDMIASLSDIMLRLEKAFKEPLQEVQTLEAWHEEFWARLVREMKEAGSDLLQDARIGADWLTIDTCIPDVDLHLSVARGRVCAALRIRSSEKENNHFIQEQFLRRKEEIEAAFGGRLTWLPGLIQHGVCGDILDRSQWDAMIAFLVDSTLRLEKALAQPLQEIKPLDVWQQEFWTRLIRDMNKAGSRLLKDAKPESRDWLFVHTCVPDTGLTFSVDRECACVALSMYSWKEKENRFIHEQLRARKGEIEAAFGGPLKWQGRNGGLRFLIQDTIPGDIRDRSQWDAMISFMTGAMLRLEQAVARPLQEARTQEAWQEEFWVRLIQEMNKTGSSLFRKVRPRAGEWLIADSCIPGAHLNFSVYDGFALVELDLRRAAPEDNQFIHEKLFARKDEIEETFGGKLVWTPLGSLWSFNIQAGVAGDVYDRDQWDAMISFMTDAMSRLEKAFQEPLQEIHDLRRQFWGRLAAAMKAAGSNMFRGAKPGSDYRLGLRTGLPGTSLGFIVSGQCAAGLFIDGQDQENEFIYSRLLPMKDEIEESFGGTLDWECPEPPWRHRQIQARVPGDILDRTQWDDMIIGLVGALLRLRGAIRRPLEEVARQMNAS